MEITFEVGRDVKAGSKITVQFEVVDIVMEEPAEEPQMVAGEGSLGIQVNKAEDNATS